MKSAPLFYKKLVSELWEITFEINWYTPLWPIDKSHETRWDYEGRPTDKRHLWQETYRKHWSHTWMFRIPSNYSFNNEVWTNMWNYQGISWRDFGSVCYTSQWLPAQNAWGWEKSWIRSQQRHSITIYTSSSLLQQSKAWYPDSGVISHSTSKGPRWGWLGKVCKRA
jgi:hypothetical protein